MCLAVPGRIVEITVDSRGNRMARIDFSGVMRDAGLEFEPDATVGDHVLVHSGFVVQRLGEEEARELISLLTDIETHAANEG